jgi:hypothetical protein
VDDDRTGALHALLEIGEASRERWSHPALHAPMLRWQSQEIFIDLISAFALPITRLSFVRDDAISG